MSSPDKATVKVVMDGILHNMARKQQKLQKVQQASIKRAQEANLEHATDGHVEYLEDDIVKGFVTTSPSIRATDCKIRGILKKVHFPESMGPPDQPDPPNSGPSPVPLSEEEKRRPLESPRAVFLPLPAPPPPPAEQPHPPQLPPPPQGGPLPPSLFTIEIESDEYLSESAYRLYTKFIDELEGFVEQQGEVINRRLAVQEKRTILKRLREDVTQCDMNLIEYVRQWRANGISSDDSTLTALFDASEAARDQAGPIEAEYEVDEIELGAEEYKLKEKYSNIEGRFEHFFRLNTDPSSLGSVPAEIQYDDSTSSSVSGGNEGHGIEPKDFGLFHGAFIGDEVGIGEEPLRPEGPLEEMFEHLNKKSREMRRPTASSDTAGNSRKQRSSATAEDKVTQESPAELAGINVGDDLDLVRPHEMKTRNRTISEILEGVASLNLANISDEQNPYLEELPWDSSLDEGDKLLLLCEPPFVHGPNEKNDYVPKCLSTQKQLNEYLTGFENTSDRVTRWILHQLRLSRCEIHTLQRHVVELAPEVSLWSNSVLDEWTRDSAGHGRSYHQGSVESIENERTSSVSAAHHQVATHKRLVSLQTDDEDQHVLPSSCPSNAAQAPTTVSDLHSRSVSIDPEDESSDKTIDKSSSIPGGIS